MIVKRMMFVCKKNSCRSQMAEGFARKLGEGKINVTSSGLEASRVHPTAIEVMSEIGIDISNQTSKPLIDTPPAEARGILGSAIELT